MSAQRGDILLSWLLKTVLWLVLCGVLLFDAGAVAVNALQLDEAAGEAAHAAALSWSAERSRRGVEQAVRGALADQPDITVRAVTVGRGGATVTVSRASRVLVADRLPPLRRYVEQTTSKTSALRL